jgi:HEPN domain-containing protein
MCVVLKIDPADAPQAEAQALDEHYMRPRYPDARAEVESEYTVETAQDALRDAHVILDFVRRSVPNAREDTDDQASADLG